jgi:hypothetical protein
MACGTNHGNLAQQTIGHANVAQSYTYDASGGLRMPVNG